MPDRQRFDFSAVRAHGGIVALRPLLSLTLSFRGRSVAVSGLVDSGADVNVLPYRLGVQLGAVWAVAQPLVRLTGNLARIEARAIIVDAQVAQLPPTRLAFAWTQSDEMPLILGQVNFFAEFNVCFYRSRRQFDIGPKASE